MVASIKQYLLGAFVTVQVVYLLLSNFMLLVPREPRPLVAEQMEVLQKTGRASRFEAVNSVVEMTGTACDRFAEVSGQIQGWSLFAPRFGPAGTFITLRAKTADGQLLEIKSHFEPEDVNKYFKFDLVHYRLFYREMSYALVYSLWEKESFASLPNEWRDEIAEYVRTFRQTLPAFVRWKLRHAGIANAQTVEVLVKTFPGTPFGSSEPRPAPVLVPLGTWSAESPDRVVAFDPTQSRP